MSDSLSGILGGRAERLFRTGKTQAKKAAAQQQEAIAAQQQKENLRLAEAASDVGTRRATAKAGGRSLLTRTSSRGVTNQLGG